MSNVIITPDPAAVFNVGRVTSYADAVKGGYQGTREEWESDLANLGTTAAEVEANRQAVAEDKAAVGEDLTTVEVYKNSAAQSASEALQSAENAHTDALAATAAKEAAQTAQGIAEEARADAVSAKGAAESAQTEANASATAATEAALAAGNAATTAAAQAGAASDSATAAAASAAAAAGVVQEVTAAKTEAITAIEAKGAETLDSIPDDYTELSGDVADLKSAISEWAADTGIWSSGGINASGTDASNDTHLRTTYLDPAEYPSAKADAGYQLYLTAYTGAGEYVGKYCTDGQFHTTFSSATVLWTDKFDLSDYPDYKLRLVMRSATEPTPTITIDEAVHCLFWHNKIDIINDKIETLEDSDWKGACLALMRSVAYLDGQKNLYAAFEEALQPGVKRLNAVFTQGDNIYGAYQSLDQFRDALTVTATYADGSTAVIDDYYLEGTLSLGTNTITVRYGGKTAAFTAVVDYLYVLREGDFRRNMNCASQEVTGEPIPYSRHINNRIAYIDFDLFLAGGKTYEIVTTVPSSYQSTAQVGIPIYNERFYNDAADWVVAYHVNDVQDHGWKSLNYNLTLPANISSSPTKGIRFSFRQSSDNPAISDDFAVERLTIREVTE